jgi:predicted ATPase
VGKSTVAIALAQRLAPALADGVAYVDLSSLDLGQSLLGALALAVGNSDGRPSSLPGLVALLCSKQMLLVLDNCDPVLENVAATSEQLLRQLPALRIVATSREPLRIRAERIEHLPTLAVPPPGVSMSLTDAKRYAAVELFVTIAERVSGPPASGDADAADVIEICRRLDGLPLALELAATQLHPLGLRGLACALREGRGLGALGFRTAPLRHRSVKASLDWGFRLLGATDRARLRRLVQLPDRFTPQAAENLCGPGVRETLADLVRKSLLAVYIDAEPIAYGFLETTRSYLVEMELEHSGYRETLPSYLRPVQAAETPSRAARPGATSATWRRRLSEPGFISQT